MFDSLLFDLFVGCYTYSLVFQDSRTMETVIEPDRSIYALSMVRKVLAANSYGGIHIPTMRNQGIPTTSQIRRVRQ